MTAQRILRHARPRVTKERYIETFDSSGFEWMERLLATVEVLEQSPAIAQQIFPLFAIRSGTIAPLYISAELCHAASFVSFFRA